MEVVGSRVLIGEVCKDDKDVNVTRGVKCVSSGLQAKDDESTILLSWCNHAQVANISAAAARTSSESFVGS
jgi:hypothetical protein